MRNVLRKVGLLAALAAGVAFAAPPASATQGTVVGPRTAECPMEGDDTAAKAFCKFWICVTGDDWAACVHPLGD